MNIFNKLFEKIKNDAKLNVNLGEIWISKKIGGVWLWENLNIFVNV